ncbi:MAG: hypothetical protein AVDCRST_MAG08-2683 [uncultured Acetobacteraceae bacterium]|uniref:Uncharacterized protein n=1 Tax=uncultured Acetobacteraceae bacterium TaxID=169975 RepID=A0A6J4IWJ2_9PROT|nr:MAG: hypothetical protein AVDCRST_MAG08-2683 [uncultured Acetobacteraceae bacterium]
MLHKPSGPPASYPTERLFGDPKALLRKAARRAVHGPLGCHRRGLRRVRPG